MPAAAVQDSSSTKGRWPRRLSCCPNATPGSCLWSLTPTGCCHWSGAPGRSCRWSGTHSSVCGGIKVCVKGFATPLGRIALGDTKEHILLSLLSVKPLVCKHVHSAVEDSCRFEGRGWAWLETVLSTAPVQSFCAVRHRVWKRVWRSGGGSRMAGRKSNRLCKRLLGNTRVANGYVQ